MSNSNPNGKVEWREYQNKLMEKTSQMIIDTAKEYQENPEHFAEFLAFGSRFYKYSIKNNILIHSQNPHAVYAQSFQAWKKMGASVKKGEEGLKVYVPVQATVLNIDGQLVPLEQATPEQRIQYAAGEIQSNTSTHFKIGTVFDIAQTTFPKEKYPSLFHMGYPSVQHEGVVKGLIEYAENELGCRVLATNLQSIALRGKFNPATNEINLNHLLEDTQKLSTLAHELGHAILHSDSSASKAQKELEAGAVGIMLAAHFGIEPTEVRKRHLADSYKAYDLENSKQKEPFGDLIKKIYVSFKKCVPGIERAVERHIPQRLPEETVREKVQKREQSEADKNLIYEEMKRQISIVDYAESHGYQTRRIGRYYTLAEHDSVRIDPIKNCFYWNSGIDPNTRSPLDQSQRGSIIDFAMVLVHNKDKHAALTELSGMLYGVDHYTKTKHEPRPEPLRKNLKEVLPEKAKNMHRVYAYLIKSRHIDQDVVQDFVNKKMLYQDQKGNCVFVAYGETGEPNFGILRGTLTEKKFTGDLQGNDYSRNFYINNKSEKLIVAESVIDAMSIMSILKGQGKDYREYDYLILAGAGKEKAIMTHLKEQPKSEVLVSPDRDLAGIAAAERIQTLLTTEANSATISFHMPREGNKDWNDELCNASKRLQPMEEIPYLEKQPLPRIHTCAIQTTEHIEEKGFRQRGDKHQYRLVELGENGEILPVKISETAQLYFTPEEVKEKIPNLYQEVTYEELLKVRKEQTTEKAQEVPKSLDEEVRQEVEAKDKPVIKGYKMEENLFFMDVEYKGEESLEAIWEGDKGYYITTGRAYDGTLEEHTMDETELEKIKDFCGGDIKAINSFPKENGIDTKNLKKESLLQQIQKQELQKSVGQLGIAPEMELGH